MKSIKFDTLAGGVLKEQFSKAFEKVIENMADVNTPYKDARKITVTLTFKQNEKRDDVTMIGVVTTKLAAQAPAGTSFAMGRNLKTGEIFVEEYGKNLAGQQSFDDIEVDQHTGEVLSQKKDDVIIFPKAARA